MESVRNLYLPSQQIDWPIVYGPLTLCNKKNQKKIQHRPPGILHFLCWSHSIALQKLSNERSYKFR